MKITFLGHSGFAVELAGLQLVFDYETGQLPSAKGERVFFVSHRHHDHFNPQIFNIGSSAQTSYILSRDVRKDMKRLAVAPETRIHYLSADKELPLPVGKESLRIRTLRSTDCGVAFLVSCGGYQIYHAGDLHCWSWPRNTKQYQNQMIAEYRREIQKLKGEKIDLAFCPLDPRLEEHEGDGLRYFLEQTDAECVWPMHMWGKFEIVNRFMESLEDENLKSRVVPVCRDGQQWEWEPDGKIREKRLDSVK